MSDDVVVVAPASTGSEIAAPVAQSRLARTVWLWPAALVAVLGLWRIGRPVMWQDELATISVASRSTGRIFHLLLNVDAVHGAYYLFIHWWVQLFGDSAASVRVPSALAMAGAAAIVALVGRRLFGARAGLLGGLVFAVVPTVSRYAQEARSYGFVVLLAVLATLLLLRAAERPGVGRWAAYAATITALVSVNAVALALVAGHGAGVALLWRRRRVVLGFGAAVVSGTLLALPILLLGAGQALRQIDWVRLLPHSPLVVWPQTFGSVQVAWAVTGLALLALVRYRRAATFAVAVAVLPPLAVWLASTNHAWYFFSKYLLFALPGWAVLAGAGLAALRWTWASAAALLSVAALGVPGQVALRGDLSHSWFTYPNRRPKDFKPMDYPAAAAMIAADYRPGDAVVYAGGPNLWWYMHDVGVEHYLPANVRLHDLFQARTAAQNDELYGTACAEPLACIGTEQRVWIITPIDPKHLYQPEEMLTEEQSKAIRWIYRMRWIRHPSGITVSLWTRPS